MKRKLFAVLMTSALTVAMVSSCAPPEAEKVKISEIPDGSIDPAIWGKNYPAEYETWKATAEPTPAGKSKYKKGNDGGKTYDKLSEYPFNALLFNGWGFGVEYNEPRGHIHMMKDQDEVDPTRVKAGGSCLSCKTPYAPQLAEKHGFDYFSKPYGEVKNLIPEEHRQLGVSCIDCHDNKDMSLKVSRGFTLGKALQALGTDQTKLTNQDKRTLVCAQCHVTYMVQKTDDMKSKDVLLPWEGSTMGNIPIENIIKKIRSDKSYGEWTQTVTGFKMAFIRHPEFEMYSSR